MSVATMLAAVNTAIEDLVGNKIASYTLDGVTYTYHSLKDLRELRTDLLKQGRTTRNIMRPVNLSGRYP